MNRVISGFLALFIGVFTLLFSLIMVIPLTIAAVITGKKIEKSLKMNRSASSQQNDRSVLEGEYEDVSK
ncbi:hypothetical protein VITU102760_04155 [Vibrio tubiashii]|jgi:UPF0716 family protein affecting phage T7 exclusion|uniref:Hydroxylamine reductase n=1 Tax=Vibrio tubiashii ATCC 19109 TaxID=1051646 RepID=F9T6F5_9VIBR|nr:hypothetical protein [Vibrio tubiashii]AIW16692.1 hydroxylamine reductase [Vibrio tubiashii ATCC 19109]EGU54618.1 hypothetical protein VITU9109_13711 [Vibrio tubiashii ATCC 19109]EIF02038.1 hypothetical protein VT1337_19942 [Vibrio tubiashii NCIMB 1337 = ATCC 19106]